MKLNTWKLGVIVAVLVGLVSYEAAAWGPRAQRAINSTAIQVIRSIYPNAFKTNDNNYEQDVLRGAAASPKLLNGGKPFLREEDAIAAVQNEIRLLRDVRKFGCGSYFSFRMGALAALVSDLILPFALDPSPQAAAIRDSMQADIDARLDSYTFMTTQRGREYVRNAKQFFAERRSFLVDGKRLIADDYQRGKGYEGYLKEAGPAFFGRAVETVADIWHTVLRVETDPSDVAPSPKVVTWYLVDQIQYLLAEKKNFHQATVAYEDFERATTDVPEAFEKVGDLFYAFGADEARDRGVREWRLAYDQAGADRRRIGKKLADHYIKIGETLLAAGTRPKASDQDLPNALGAFTQAIEFDQTNDLAARRINETNVAISERKARRELNVNMIASADKVMVQAEKSRLAGDFGNAIATYNQAIGLFQAVGEEFEDQSRTAKESAKEINKNITDIINEVLDAASDAIDKGDKAVDEHRWDDAVTSYNRVPNIVNVVPGDASTTHGKDKLDIIELSKKKIDDAKLARNRYEETERQRKAAAEVEAAKRGGAR
jgi:tetratricopeptide (TPR) repeat protein